MAVNILNIGKSALTAAQVGISVTGHNIANAATPGYSRQEVVQRAAEAQDYGFGYLGQGAEISQVKRAYSQVIAQQMHSAQTSSSATNAYATQMIQIDNMLSDVNAGLSPAIQEFFSSVQGLSSNPGDAASRQAVISKAEALTNRFQSIGNQLDEIREGVNSELVSSTKLVTAYATQIASLNDVISKALGADKNNAPNDLMDQRDQIIAEMNKLIKTDIYTQDDGSYNVFVGNGVPLVVGGKSYGLTTVSSTTDASRLEVAYVSNTTVKPLSESSLPGGSIGGLLQFRSSSLDNIQNQIGQIATVIAETFNAQHKLGFDPSGTAGGNFFNAPTPQVFGDTANSVTATLNATISSATALTSSDYKLKYDGTNYSVTRVSDGTVQTFASLPQTVDGLTINGTMAAGDSFLIQPTRGAATTFSVAISDINKIAAADATGGNGNNRNALELAALQRKPLLNNSALTYESAFGQVVSAVGNKTHELKVVGASEDTLLAQATAAQQSESGVNLDEEATNLLRYQQAYQAAGKVMQIASSLFDMLLTIGH